MMPDEIYVVFTDRTDIPLLRLLQRGYRHCYVLLRFADIWMCIDPLLHKTEVMRLDLPEAFSLTGWLDEQGEKAVKIDGIKACPRVLCPMPISCVESVKRIIGLQSFCIVTPRQLYNHLTKNDERKA